MSLWTKFNIILFVLNIIYLFNPVLSVDCSTAKSSTACGNINGCIWSNSVCSCDSSLNMDVVIAMDSSGSIGSSDFVKEKTFVAQLVNQGLSDSARISIIEFGTDSQIILNFTQSDVMTSTQLVAFVNAITYWAGYTNTVGAIQQALYVFNTFSYSNRTKLFLIVTDGNPNMPNGGSVDVCNYANALKTAGIVTVIIGVGSSWDPDIIDCLVTDVNEYIIEVDDYSSFDAILPDLTDITCPVSYSLLITEVQADLDNSTFGSRFVEMYNTGSDVTLTKLSLSGLFNGPVTSNSSIILKQGQYLVVYDNDSPSSKPNCFNCSCTKVNGFCTNALYIPCGSGYSCYRSTTATGKNWYLTLTDTSTSTVTTIDSLSYSNSTWPSITQGFSYELKSLGYNNDDGGNWEMSCYTYGTPGYSPVTICGCTTAKCSLNGDSATCTGTSNNICNCNGGYYYSSSSSTCYLVPPPKLCYAYHYKNGSTPYVKFVWEKADTDQDVRYTLMYNSSINGDISSISTSSRVKYAYDIPDVLLTSSTIYIGTVRTTIGNYYSTSINCLYQTPAPSVAPTPAPTDYPRVWIGGDICSKDRCDCNNRAWNCDCENEQDKWGCNSTRIEKLFSESNDEQYITIKTWPGDFISPFIVCWTITPGAGNTTTTTTTNSPSVNNSLTTTYSNIGEATTSDMSITEGCITFSSNDEEKITIIIYDEATGTDSPYEYFLLEIVNCTDPVQCDKVYPKTLLMKVEDQVYAKSLLLSNSKSSTPTWLWWLIAALILILLLIAFLAYRWWRRNSATQAKLDKTEKDLEVEKEENELGFGHDLDQGDVGFNPLATGIPNSSHPSGGLASELENRQAIVPQPNADVQAERFQHRMEYGQTLPEKRKM